MELDERIYEKICILSQEGDMYCDEDKFELAEKKYREALDLLPNPKAEWEASTWLYVAIGEVYFWTSRYKESLHLFDEALKCPDGLDNPLINLRIGQCYYEMNKYDLAKEYLLRAYMVGGHEVFEGEDIKYINLIQRLK